MNFNVFYPFEIFATWLSYDVFRLTQGSHLGDAVEFFIYDLLKILALMIVITHIMSLMRFYLPIEKLRDYLTKHKFYGLDYFLATVFGALTPFCTCSSIPLFVGFLEARIPLGVTFAFLITSPLVNEAAVAMFIGIFGWKVAGIYVLSGIVIGMVGGFVLGKMKLEKYVEDFVWKIKSDKISEQIKERMPWKKIAVLVSKEAFDITKKIAVYIVAGIAIGALIHGFVPQGFFEKYLENAGVFGVPLAVILAVPMYSNATGVIPIIQALVAKGMPLGTALAFMMGVVGLSLPEALILKKILKWQLLTWFFGVVTVGIIIIGYLFNLIF